MINNRQNGRRRGRGGNGGGNGQGQGQRGPQNNGSRIDNRARGNASQLYEKYKNMAADAQRAGDRVNTEYYFQFADHYFRVLSEQRGRFEDQPQQSRRARDDFDFDGEEEFGDEGEPARSREGWGEQGAAEPVRADREESRRRDGGDLPREAGQRDGSQRDGRREWRDRPDRRPDARSEAPVAGQHRAEPIAPGESTEGRAAEVIEADRPLDPPMPRRRGRARRDESGEVAGEPSGFEADRLPPALTPTLAGAANDAEPALEAPKPRRRRARVEATDAPTAAE